MKKRLLTAAIGALLWQGGADAGSAVNIGWLVEIEAMRTDDRDLFDPVVNTDLSRLDVPKIELGVDVDLSGWAKTHLLFLMEEGDSGGKEMTVDEYNITIANGDRTPFSLTAGRLPVPFGAFETNRVTDPLTLEMGETKEEVAMLGYEARGFTASLYTFNGDLDAGGGNKADNLGAALGYGNGNFTAGMGWINDIGDSGGLTDAIGANPYASNIPGAEAHAKLTLGRLNLIGEYLAATESFDAGTLAFNGLGARPEAWNLEAGYTFENGILGRETTIAAGVQGTAEAQALGLPEERRSLGVSIALFEKTRLGLEWLHDKDYGLADGGTGDSSNTYTAQLAVEF